MSFVSGAVEETDAGWHHNMVDGLLKPLSRG